jgi:hypothetical protein
LSLAQIRALIDLPPSFDKEREVVVELLRTLQDVGVQLDLTKPRKRAAAAEWDGAARTLRIDPSVVGHGTVDFARVLNHEAIHVAQSCFGGGLRAYPKLLGIDNQLTPELAEQLCQPEPAGVGGCSGEPPLPPAQLSENGFRPPEHRCVPTASAVWLGISRRC